MRLTEQGPGTRTDEPPIGLNAESLVQRLEGDASPRFAIRVTDLTKPEIFSALIHSEDQSPETEIYDTYIAAPSQKETEERAWHEARGGDTALAERLPAIVGELQYASAKSLQVVEDSPMSWKDHCKAFVEQRSDLEWDWWPWSPPEAATSGERGKSFVEMRKSPIGSGVKFASLHANYSFIEMRPNAHGDFARINRKKVATSIGRSWTNKIRPNRSSADRY